MRLFSVASVLGIVVGSLGACDSAPTTPVNTPPPKVCRSPAGLTPIHFTDVTADVGLAPTATFNPLSVGAIAADFDGDGWSDLVVTTGWSQAGNFVGAPNDPHDGMRVRHLLMNRPDPNDPTHRVFVDATDESGILASRSGTGERGFGLVNAGDLDDDGDVDLITCPEDVKSNPPANSTGGDDVEDPCSALLNDGTGHFTFADASDLDAKGAIWVPSAALFDYDRDGVLDFYPGTIAHWPYPVDPTPPNTAPALFHGNGDGTFANVVKTSGLPVVDGSSFTGQSFRYTFGVTACDLDGDGDDDVILADYGRQENQVWRNDNGHFTNVSHDWGLDYDDNQDYTDDQSYLCWCQNNPNAGCPANTPAPAYSAFCTGFYQGDIYGRGWTPGITDKSFSLGGNNFSFACGDIDDDGDMDLMSATIVHGDVGQSADPSELILNPGDGTKFVRPGNQKTGLYRPVPNDIFWNHGDNQVAFVDIDNDGRKDIFLTDTAAYDNNGVVGESHVYLWHQKADGTFEDVTLPSGVIGANKLPHLEGPTFVDIDGDGDLDIIAGDANTWALHVLRNDSGQDQNWTRIRLVGGGFGAANTSGIGAVVKVTAGGRTQTQYVSGGFGHGNIQNDLVLTFGLGAACDIDKVEVRWPDAAGSTQTFTGVVANYNVTLKQGQPDPEYR
jgi:hypothetical protein